MVAPMVGALRAGYLERSTFNSLTAFKVSRGACGLTGLVDVGFALEHCYMSEGGRRDSSHGGACLYTNGYCKPGG
ncbi:MAG: hypothetical protein ACO2O2_01215 [Acidilobaceae archaeon]